MGCAMVNKDWTFEEALEANEADLAKTPGRSSDDPSLPLFKWMALQQLEGYREAFKTDSYYLMTAIRTCANHDLPLPEWAAKAYISAYDTINNAEKKSWDDVFGKPYPKGRHLNAINKKKRLRFAVFFAVEEKAKSLPIDEGLFEEVGKKFNIQKTLASEYYYEAKKIIGAGGLTNIKITENEIQIETNKRE